MRLRLDLKHRHLPFDHEAGTWQDLCLVLKRASNGSQRRVVEEERLWQLNTQTSTNSRRQLRGADGVEPGGHERGVGRDSSPGELRRGANQTMDQSIWRAGSL